MNDTRLPAGAKADALAALEGTDAFIARHIGTAADDQVAMVEALGYPSLSLIHI